MNDMSNAAMVADPITRADLTEAVRATALLVDLTISLWSGERTDRKISEKVKADANAVGNAVRAIKNLMAGCDTQLREVRAAYTAVRAKHYALTLPWVANPHAERNTGSRLLPNMLFHEYTAEIATTRRAAQDKLDAFMAAYPSLIQQAQANLAGLADPKDYPSEAEVRAAFRIDVDFQPVPDAAGFHGLPDAMLGKLGERLQARQARSIAAAQADMWGRVRDTVGHMAGRLAEQDSKFKSSTVESVRELVKLLPGFNCAGDERVDPVVEDIRGMLDGITAEDIRKDLRVREDVVAKAQALTERLNAWGI